MEMVTVMMMTWHGLAECAERLNTADLAECAERLNTDAGDNGYNGNSCNGNNCKGNNCNGNSCKRLQW